MIGTLPCSEVTLDHILAIFKPIWTTKNETATKFQGRLEIILDWAVVSGYRTGDNPAIWTGKLSHLLPTINKRQPVARHLEMPYAPFPALFQALFQSIG